MDTERFQYKQELDVFLSLCPYELLSKIFKKGSLPYPDYINGIRMLKALGFSELAEVYLLTDHEKFRSKSHILKDYNSDKEIFDEMPFVKEFVHNIHFPAIKSMFIKRINEFYNEKIFNES